MRYFKPLLTLITTLFCFNPIIAFAEDQANFSVVADQSPYQVDKDKTYFDLALPANETVDLTIHVTNNSDEAITIAGEVAQATTNLNGVVEYSKTDNKLTQKVPFDVTTIASFDNPQQTIDAHQTVDFVVHVTAPTTDYAGIVAGGISFHDVTEEKATEDTAMFKNKFAYAIALLLHGNQEAEKNDLMLTKVAPGQVNSRNVINATIANQTSNYVSQVTVKAKVLDSNGKEVLSDQKENLQIAPDSVFQFPVYYNGQEMKAGNYRLQLTVSSGDQTWELEKEFTITKKKAEKLNKTDVSPKEETNYSQWLVIGLLASAVVLLVILIVLVVRKRR